MKNKIFIIYIVQIAVMIIFITFSNKNVQSKIFNKSDNYLDAFNNGWYMIDKDGNNKYIEAPSKQNVKEGEKLIIYNHIPSNDIDNITLRFPTTHSFVNVFADDKLIYSFGLENEHMASTPGCCWNFVNISKEYYGKDIKVEIKSNYSSASGKVPSFIIGTEYTTKCNLIQSKILDLIVVFITIIVAVFLVIISTIFRQKYMIKDNLIYIGIFSLMISGWQLTDTNILPVFFGHYYVLSMLSFIFLLMSSFPLIEYVRKTYCTSKKENQILIIFDIVAVCIGITLMFLHLFGVLEFRTTFFVYHIFIVVAFLFALHYLCKKVIRKDYCLSKWHLIIGILSVLNIVYDLYRYIFKYGERTSASSLSTRILILLMIVFLSCDSFKVILKLINDGKQIDSIKNIAFHDSLTKLRNRAAFDDRMNQIPVSMYSNYGIVMLDLNNLKYFNDIFGHEMGDEYIISSTKIIGDIFADKGQPYRIGGDEFCIIVPKLSDTEYYNIREIVEKRAEELNCIIYEKKMGISIGYATFNVDLDIDLYSTMNRADMLMYEYKQKNKK